MKITQLAFKNFRGFRDFSLSFSKGVTLLVAMNGVGKTSVIEGLASALWGFKRGVLADSKSKLNAEGVLDEADYRRERLTDQNVFYTEPKLAIDVSAEWDETTVLWQLMSYSPETEKPRQVNPQIKWPEGRKDVAKKLRSAAKDNNIVLPLLLALRAKRLSRGEKKPQADYGQRTASAPERLPAWAEGPYFDQDWYSLRTLWSTLEYDREIGKANAKYANAACESIVSALRNALELEKPPLWSPDESDFEIKLPNDSVRLVGLMSDGWRAYVSIVVGLAMRCAEINPLRTNAPEITPGVLLIDELEQHLHPHLQLEILDGIRRAFPLLQIVATTHSPLILTDAVGAADNSIVRLDRHESDEIVATPLIAPVGKNVLQVLTGDWFGLPSTFDDETLRMLAEHREMLREGPTKRDQARALAEKIRARLGRYAETSVEELVLSVVAELERDARFEKLSHQQIRELREDVIGRIKAGLT